MRTGALCRRVSCPGAGAGGHACSPYTHLRGSGLHACRAGDRWKGLRAPRTAPAAGTPPPPLADSDCAVRGAGGVTATPRPTGVLLPISYIIAAETRTVESK